MIVKREGGDTRVELGDVVGSLRTKIVDFVSILMPHLQELHHVIHRVPVHCLQVLAREPHRYNTI